MPSLLLTRANQLPGESKLRICPLHAKTTYNHFVPFVDQFVVIVDQFVVITLVMPVIFYWLSRSSVVNQFGLITETTEEYKGNK